MNPSDLTATRRSLHAVAESVIAGPQHRLHGTIRMGLRPGGFGGTALDVAVDGGDLVWPGGRTALDGSTCRELAGRAGLEAGIAEGLYRDTSGVGMDESLVVDAAVVADLAAWLATGDAALRRIAPGDTPVLWPEHFDLAIALGDATVGVSPGDGWSPEPYAYVSVATAPLGEAWNAPFGAFCTRADLPDAEAVEAYLRSIIAQLPS